MGRCVTSPPPVSTSPGPLRGASMHAARGRVTFGRIHSRHGAVSVAPEMPESYEVIVLGGGPGGAATAGLLAAAGRRVLVLERDAFPRFHVGESLLPCSMPMIERLGAMPAMEAEFLRKYGARFIDDATGRESRFSFSDALRAGSPYAFEVPRDRFDQVLLERAAAVGAEVHHGWEATR